MQTEEKLALIVGASMVVLGTAGLVIIDRITQKRAKQASEEYREARMQEGWEMIQRSRAFTTCTPDQRIVLFDSYWKTTGGVKSHTP
jgi:hypothetical protein